MPDIYLIGLVIVLALTFDFINGFHDTANAIATCVATRALNPRLAIIMSAVLNFAGAMVFTGVAKTIGGEIVTSPSMVDSVVIIAALTAAILWNLLTWKFGLPSSSSHALIGGICGSVIISYGLGAIHGEGILMIVLGLVLSPVVAMIGGYVLMTILYMVLRKHNKKQVNSVARKVQIFSAALTAFSHGANDAQKCMGIITLALLSGGYIAALEVPLPVKIACAFAMSAGTSVGGWSIIKTVGTKIFRMQPINGVAADVNSSLTIFIATLLKLPVSTTHVVSGSIMGVGWAHRFRAVHWSVAYQMVFAWVMTIPCTAAVGAIIYLIFHHLGL
jgi:PiT family inorganic phosphate transporter